MMFKTIALAAALAIGAGAATAQTPPKQERSATDIKKAECKKEAKAKKFGIHFIQRKRFIEECMKRT